MRSTVPVIRIPRSGIPRPAGATAWAWTSPVMSAIRPGDSNVVFRGAQASGQKNPNTGISLEKTLKTKAEFVKAETDSFAFCDPVYAALTDATGMEVLDITQESGRQVRQPRMALLIMNVSHNSEIYGNIVTTMRMKSIVPPSSEPRPQTPQPR